MLKIFLTGDNHIGLAFDRYHEIKDKLKQSRLESMERMIQYANENGCDLFVVAGDLFHRFSGISKKTVRKVTEILNLFDGTVLVLPGNHDYYSPDIRLWQDFEECMKDKVHIHLLTEFQKYEYEMGDGSIAAVYPAMCQSKHSHENNLQWMRGETMDPTKYNIGIAHGAIRGVTPDMKNEYFLMDEKELREIPVDVWLIGHTHVPYPENVPVDDLAEGFSIFNAGTHEQTDLSCRTEGNGFLICIDEKKKILAKRFVCGKIRYYDLKVKLEQKPVEQQLSACFEGIDRENAVVRLVLTGSINSEQYKERGEIYRKFEEQFLSMEIQDSELSEQISEEKLKDEFTEMSFPAKFLQGLKENTTELQMAYDLIRQIRE